MNFGSAIKIGVVAVSLMVVSFLTQNAHAQDDAKAFGSSLAAPVYDSIDENGVDMISGFLRIQSPTLQVGTPERPTLVGLQWTGRGWVHLGVPNIWRTDDGYIVNYRGRSDEFRGYKSNFSQRKPVNGASLECSVILPQRWTFDCTYISSEGDVVYFDARPDGANIPIIINGYAYIGNMRIYRATVDSPRYGNSAYSAQYGSISYSDSALVIIGSGGETSGNCYYCRNPEISINQKYKMIVTTPNNNRDLDEHYLRPRNTVQTITDTLGNVWQYDINSDREIRSIIPPAGQARIDYKYTGGHRVREVSTPDGIWTYSYSTPGDFRVITRTDPQGGVYRVKSHRKRGYVVEVTDELSRTTTYDYDDGRRVIKITYPELNSLNYTYDTRGNVTLERHISKNGALTLSRSASYPPTCTNRRTCNQPIWVTDAKGNRTDFVYNTDGLPTVITGPAPASGQPRPQIRNTYENGILTESSTCISGSSCTGTADEVRTQYQYARRDDGTIDRRRFLLGTNQISGGTQLRTCYQYNELGWKVSETQPNANLASCSTEISGLPSANPGAISNVARSAPTYPGSSSGSNPPPPPPPGGGNPPPPPIEPPNCGPNPCL